MEHLARAFIFLEMLSVNLITTHNCSKEKHSLIKIIIELIIFTIFILFICYFLKLILHVKYLNRGIITLIGFSYLIPLKHIYDESIDRIMAIMFFSWIHTITVTSISIQISEINKFDNHYTMALIIQTLLYLFSTPIIIKFIKYKFLYILKNIPDNMNKYLVALSFIEFTTLAMINTYFNNHLNSYIIVTMVILVGFTAAISYHLIYVIVNNFKNISFFKQLAYSDNLTGIKNRLALIRDCEKLIFDNQPFTFIYMDLDNFKQINDTYGHSVGDDYLIAFTKAAISTICDKDSIYRMSGDEFVCIYMDERIDFSLDSFNDKIISCYKFYIPFLGVSVGYSKFPDEAKSLDMLMTKADNIMYKVKNK